jgi:hypothetical protein
MFGNFIINNQKNGSRDSVIISADSSNTPANTSGFSIDNLLSKLETDKANTKLEIASNQAKIEASDGETLIKAVSKEKKIDDANSFLAIAIICQKGGTSKKAQGDIYATVNGSKITLNDIRNIIKNQNMKFTLRQWARTYGSPIHRACEIYSIDGDLAKILTRKDDSLNPSDLIWCSNFQMDNPDCPSNVRDHIKSHFSELFGKKDSN